MWKGRKRPFIALQTDTRFKNTRRGSGAEQRVPLSAHLGVRVARCIRQWRSRARPLPFLRPERIEEPDLTRPSSPGAAVRGRRSASRRRIRQPRAAAGGGRQNGCSRLQRLWVWFRSPSTTLHLDRSDWMLCQSRVRSSRGMLKSGVDRPLKGDELYKLPPSLPLSHTRTAPGTGPSLFHHPQQTRLCPFSQRALRIARSHGRRGSDPLKGQS